MPAIHRLTDFQAHLLECLGPGDGIIKQLSQQKGTKNDKNNGLPKETVKNISNKPLIYVLCRSRQNFRQTILLTIPV